jgi:Fe-S oxidoreductase
VSAIKTIIHLETDLHPIPVTTTEPEKRVERTKQLFERMKNQCRAVVMAMENCTKCGRCAKECHVYLGTGDPDNIPAARADLMRAVYKKYFTAGGKLLGSFVGARELDDELLEKWVNYFYQCNECRRCAVFCPLGIDTAEVTIMARQILVYLGLVPKFHMSIAKQVDKTGNNMGIPKGACIDSCEFIEDEIREETGVDVKIPVDQKAEILYVPSSADFFTNFDTMVGAAKFFHAIGANWTISSEILEAGNFGLFFDHDFTMKSHNNRLVRIAKKLGVKKVVQGECGHGWRAARMYTPSLSGPVPFEITHIIEEAAAAIQRGQLKLDPSKNDDKIVTLHDPCNAVRSSNLMEEPRIVLRACVNNFVEMYPNREKNFCCGSGGGILMEEMIEWRKKVTQVKRDQVRATGANYLCAPCSICKAQFPVAFEGYEKEVPGFKIGGLMDLVGYALVLE